jgi:hypothetical protein
MLWFLIVLFRAYAEERKESTSSRKVERRLTQTWHERDGEEDAVQADTWQNTVGANDGMVEHRGKLSEGTKTLLRTMSMNPLCDIANNEGKTAKAKKDAGDIGADIEIRPFAQSRKARRKSYLERQAKLKKLSQRKTAQAASAAPQLKIRSKPLPTGWTRILDEVSGKYYLHDEETGQSMWEEGDLKDILNYRALTSQEGNAPRYTQYESVEGKSYFVPLSGNGEAVWSLPEGAELVQ